MYENSPERFLHDRMCNASSKSVVSTNGYFSNRLKLPGNNNNVITAAKEVFILSTQFKHLSSTGSGNMKYI